ncbi:MAG: T9SS type A sorting domain-containing protein [bacterium]|nr:T9SS type A sorting domain-containing protein [bacterium]
MNYTFMKKELSLILCLFLFLSMQAQEKSTFTYDVKNLSTPLGAKVNLSELPSMPDAHIINIKAAPAPLSDKQLAKQNLDAQRLQHVSQKALNKKKAAADAPSLGLGFTANITQGTPNDNDFCIGNNGMMISCVNTNFTVYNDTGRAIVSKSLGSLGSALGPLNRTYDPRTIYDPEQDRYIIVFLQGSSSLDTRIIVAFSTSSDPSKTWNLYQIPGNITGDSSWSDYPIISLSKKELFITVNRLKDNTFWKNGFLESYIWQVDKMKGYAGDSLPQKVYNNIKYNDKPLWSICPAKGGSKLYGPEMYFLSHRPSDLSNDSVFVHYISNTIESGVATLSSKVLRNPVAYGLQPNAIQPNGRKLQTNDARVLSAMYEGGVISYVGNTIDTGLFAPGVYYGRIHEIWTDKPRLEGTIISYDSMDIGYPSIAYVGSGENGDHSSMITFSHVSPSLFPGTSVVYIDRKFNVSAPVFVKKGEGNIRVIFDSVERWGDYTGIQKRYNELGVAWLNGSWGNTSNQNRTWVAKVISNDPLSGVQSLRKDKGMFNAYPNPVAQILYFEFESKQKKMMHVELIGLDGKKNLVLAKDWAKSGLNQLQIDVQELPNGLYFVNLISDEGLEHSFKFIVQH